MENNEGVPIPFCVFGPPYCRTVLVFHSAFSSHYMINSSFSLINSQCLFRCLFEVVSCVATMFYMSGICCCFCIAPDTTLCNLQEYQVAYVIVKAGNAPRPGVWALEKSADGGKTFQPWQYFATSASECLSYFGVTPLLRPVQDDTVICSIEYSQVPPFENGEVWMSWNL